MSCFLSREIRILRTATIWDMLFLPTLTEEAALDDAGIERRLSVILAADVVGYSRLIREDEAGTLAALKAHRAGRPVGLSERSFTRQLS